MSYILDMQYLILKSDTEITDKKAIPIITQGLNIAFEQARIKSVMHNIAEKKSTQVKLVISIHYHLPMIPPVNARMLKKSQKLRRKRMNLQAYRLVLSS